MRPWPCAAVLGGIGLKRNGAAARGENKKNDQPKCHAHAALPFLNERLFNTAY